MTKSHISFYFLLTLFVGCGGESHNSDAFNGREEEVPEPETLQRVYRADLRPVNAGIVKRVEGQVLIRLEDDSFEANLAVRNVPAAVHRQSINALKSCPDEKSDTNQNGIVERSEADAVSGPVYIPLDGDLDNIAEDERSYPNGGFLRAYVYREETSRSRLLADLGPGADFDLENRVVIIYGTDEDANLPIACGELTRVIGSDP